jgi:hypothetical protein
MSEIVASFEQLNPEIDHKDLSTWTEYNLPPQTRPGLFQCLMGHIKPVWAIRENSKIRKIFKDLYSELSHEEVTDFVCSFDGINVLPNGSGHYHKEGNDWGHLDQTYGDIFDCIQGQAVLTNTSASFVATPVTHRHFSEILDLADVSEKDKSNWCKFSPDKVEEIKTYLASHDIQYQIPILAPAGSLILWTSSTIHAAKLPDHKEKPSNDDKWKGWRGVVYVCHRPRDELSDKALKRRKLYFEDNRMTSHWGDTVVSKRPGGRYLYTKKRHERIEAYLDDPTLIYEDLEKPEASDLI